MNLTDDEIESIAERVAEKFAQRFLLLPASCGERMNAPKAKHATISRGEAIAYINRRSVGAFRNFCAKYGVEACAHDRYDTTDLDIAISKERRGGYSRPC
jgi:hypothetical protein